MKNRISQEFSAYPNVSAKLLSVSDYYVEGQRYNIIYGNVLKTYVQEALINAGKEESSAMKKAGELVDAALERLQDDYLVFDKRTVRLEHEDCSNCPAYRWVIHREGYHLCRLFFDIEEKANESDYSAKPVHECIRPLTVGASYTIAKQLGLEEPMVGKIRKEEYDRYIAEKETAQC